VKNRFRLIAFILLLSTVGCDRVTKHFAQGLENSPPRIFLGGTLRFEYAENPGAFLNLGSNWPSFLRTGVLTFGVGIGLAISALLAWRRHWGGPFLMGLALVWAGGASNFIDRVFRGRVVDFMVLQAGPLETGVFNMADIAIVLGAALLLVAPSKNSSALTGRGSLR